MFLFGVRKRQFSIFIELENYEAFVERKGWKASYFGGEEARKKYVSVITFFSFIMEVCSYFIDLPSSAAKKTLVADKA